MIEKMTKYSFIMLSSYTEDFLQKLQEIGMMDITRSRKPVDEASAALLDRMKDCKTARIRQPTLRKRTGQKILTPRI